MFFVFGQTVKVKSNPFLMESNCMKMCHAGTKKRKRAERGEETMGRKRHDVCLEDRERDRR